MASDTLKVALVGTGGIGKIHLEQWRQVERAEIAGVFDVSAESARQAAEEFEVEVVYESLEDAVADDTIDAVDICVPNNLHREIAIAAAEAGKIIRCEKPLSMNTAEGEEMCAAVEKAGVANIVWYNYRRVPAVTLAKQIVDSGKLGKIFHYRANFLQDWTISADLPQGGAALWRLDSAAAGSGVTGDLLAHCIDTAIWINGGISTVTAMTETFIKERRHQLTGKVEKVGIDDACAFLCRFANGSLGLFESTRYARGHKALYTFEINGAHASIKWDLHDLHRLEFFDHSDDSQVRGWRSIHVSDGDHPYMDHWWVPGLQIGFEHSFVHHVADFLEGLAKGEAVGPTFRDALETQKVCDAVLGSAKELTWKEVG